MTALWITDIIRSAEYFAVAGADDSASQADGNTSPRSVTSAVSTRSSVPKPRVCDRCGYISSQPLCQACVLLEGLNKGRSKKHVTLQVRCWRYRIQR